VNQFNAASSKFDREVATPNLKTDHVEGSLPA